MDTLSTTGHLLLSPPAMALLPVLVLQLVMLGYLLSWKAKSVPTRLLLGWLLCTALVIASQLSKHVIYAPWATYVDWFGGTLWSLIALLLWTQFAYRFPRRVYPREARVLLVVHMVVLLAILGLMIFEEINRSPGPDSYIFEQFRYGSVGTLEDRVFTSPNLFSLWLALGYSWVLLLYLRQTVLFSGPAPSGRRSWWERPRCALRSIRRPLGKDAHAARAFVGVMLVTMLPVMTSILEPWGLPLGSFAIAYLLAILVMFLSYINHAPEPSTFMAKLVGISLVTILMMLEGVTLTLLDSQQTAYLLARRAQVAHVEELVQTGHLEQVPAQVLYIAARPAEGGLFSPTYELLFSRREDLSAQMLERQDALLRADMEQDVLSTALLVSAEYPSLTPGQIEDHYGEIALPVGVQSYRGSYAPPEQHFIRYGFVVGDARYEVGYSYLDYRQDLHEQALPLVYLTIGVTLLVVFIFPLFFQANMVRPLTNLRQGVDRVDQGDLEVVVPVAVEDEIGFLTRAFNRMVRSLQTAELDLRREMAERQRAEEEVRRAEKLRRSEEEAIAEERRRIAREIHDGLAQDLASLRLRSEVWQLLLEDSPEKLRGELARLQEMLGQNIREVRRAIFALRPAALEELGFFPALERFAEEFGEQNQLHVDLHVAGPRDRLPPQLEPVLFRLVQEALNNVAKHAQAGAVWVHLDLEMDDVVSLHVRDDGIGFDPDTLEQAVREGHLGLRQMRERVEQARGTFSLQSQPGQGTIIQITLPLPGA